MGQAIYEGLRQYSLSNGPRICNDIDRAVVIWTERPKQTVLESDLEANYEVLREVMLQVLRFGEKIYQYHYEVWIWGNI